MKGLWKIWWPACLLLCVVIAGIPGVVRAGGSTPGKDVVNPALSYPDGQGDVGADGFLFPRTQYKGSNQGEKQCLAYIMDHTLAQRWVEGVPDPGGEAPHGWYDAIGDPVFNTFQINVQWQGNDVLIWIHTNFPEQGVKDGTPIGYVGQSYWQVADLAFDLDMDGVWETGLALTDHGALPEDPSGPNPPGYGLPADQFEKGVLYDVDSWFSADDIHRYHSGYGGEYGMDNPQVGLAWMRTGNQKNMAEVTWIRESNDSPDYTVHIILKNVNTEHQWDHFYILWCTANCCNDVVVGEALNSCSDGEAGPMNGDPDATSVPVLGAGGIVTLTLLLLVVALIFLGSKRMEPDG